jgi:hypothetical protein
MWKIEKFFIQFQFSDFWIETDFWKWKSFFFLKSVEWVFLLSPTKQSNIDQFPFFKLDNSHLKPYSSVNSISLSSQNDHLIWRKQILSNISPIKFIKKTAKPQNYLILSVHPKIIFYRFFHKRLHIFTAFPKALPHTKRSQIYDLFITDY